MFLKTDIEGMNNEGIIRASNVIKSMEIKQVNRLKKFKDQIQDSIHQSKSKGSSFDIN